jgi:2-iminobutanoate/2-iminopropanoate deaminase
MSVKKVLRTPFWSRPAELGPWSQGIRVPAGHDLVFTTGMTARDEQGETVAPGDVTAQTRRILEQLQGIVAEAGAGMEDVVKLTVYIVDMDDVLAIQAVRDEFWQTEPPVSATIQVARLVNDQVRIEIDAIAVVP